MKYNHLWRDSEVTQKAHYQISAGAWLSDAEQEMNSKIVLFWVTQSWCPVLLSFFSLLLVCFFLSSFAYSDSYIDLFLTLCVS